jgi:uroporphyrin-III C-methyltransferase
VVSQGITKFIVLSKGRYNMTKEVANHRLSGILALIGAGPGDPDLLTVGAYKALLRAEVVLFDRLVTQEILDLAPSSAEKINVGKELGEQSGVQEKIFDQLLRALAAGKFVVRLKGGDPMVFGRGIEEWLFAAELNCEVQIHPGVSSCIAAPELAGIPVTARGCAEGFAVVTGHRAKPHAVDWSAYAQVETLVILMGVRNRQHIAEALIKHGRNPEDQSAFIENGSRTNQKIVRCSLSDIARGHIDVQSPAVWITGAVTRFHDVLAARQLPTSGELPENTPELFV